MTPPLYPERGDSAGRVAPLLSSPRKPPLLFLVGPRGSGKTTVARLAAPLLGWDWIDADEELQRRHGSSIREIFAAEGEGGFRDKETAVLRDLCGLRDHVIATGGGVILRAENRALLRENGSVIYLTADVDTLWRRIASDPASAGQRPALMTGGPPVGVRPVPPGREEVEEVLRLRDPLYRACADHIITTGALPPEDVAAAVAAASERSSRDQEARDRPHPAGQPPCS